MAVTTPEEWLRKLMEVHAVQGREGNWNYSPYMRGMFNGLELALSIVQNERKPRYKEAPANYMSDDRDKAYPDYLSYERADKQHTEAVTVYGIGVNEWDRYQRMVQDIHQALTWAIPHETALDADMMKALEDAATKPQRIVAIPRDPMDPALVSEALISWLKTARDVWEHGTPEYAILNRLLDDARDNAVVGRMPWDATEADDTDAMRVTYPKHGSDTPTAVLPRVACSPGCAEAHTYGEGCVMAMTLPTSALPTVPERVNPGEMPEGWQPKQQAVNVRPIRDNPQA